jgi:23S rRNA (uracil1939-C5)-methyltransferase
MLTPGRILSLTIDKPAAGGRMIARVDGQVVLVGGAIPGERVTARVERVAKGVAYADTLSADEPSADRRAAPADPLCGGCLYAHIAYPRQLGLKSLVIADAFGRIAHLPLPSAVRVAASPEEGYRMRARLHVRGQHWGFFREGTHEICDARATRQLLPATCEVLDRLVADMRSLGLADASEIELSENVDASERVVHVDAPQPLGADAPGAAGAIDRLRATPGLTPGPYVTDVLALDAHPPIRLRRHVLAFFQGNRFLLRDLVAHVVAQVPQGCAAVDLYAGAGLFAIAAGVSRAARVTAVEGDRFAAADLAANAVASGAAVAPVHQAVEAFTARPSGAADVVILDPPRTGVSREALAGVLRIGAPRLVYVSCDIATLARDARRLVDGGYALQRVDAFDLFPNTPHVETVAIFESRVRSVRL